MPAPLLGLAALGCSSHLDAACSRAITMAYATSQVATEYAARPTEQLPALHDALADLSGCKITVLSYPTARVIKGYLDGSIDIIAGVAQSPERDAVGSFVADKSGGWVLLTTQPAGAVPERLEDFASHRELLVGILRGATYPAQINVVIDTLRTQGQIDEFRDFKMGMEKLQFKRDAALFSTDTNYKLIPDAATTAGLRAIVQPQFPSTFGGLYVSRKSLSEPDLGLLLDKIESAEFKKLDDQLRHARLRELGESNR
jgi:hypothetical protein